MRKETAKKLAIVTLFAIAMAFVETVVVVFLRMIYYPQGFSFPLNPSMPSWVYGMEWVRELATIIMLMTIGYLAGKRFIERFGYFIYAFAVWDIFYYIWLKVILNWPESLLTNDLLFLIPTPWVGPVLAPVICSLMMIALHFVIINAEERGKKTRINSSEWFLLITGSAIILFTWLIDYTKLIMNGRFTNNFFGLLTDTTFQNAVARFMPTSYNWPLFSLGIALILVAILLFYKRNR